jgi:hypothetical protein
MEYMAASNSDCWFCTQPTNKANPTVFFCIYARKQTALTVLSFLFVFLTSTFLLQARQAFSLTNEASTSVATFKFLVASNFN